MLSIDPPQVASEQPPSQGIASSALQPLISWFRQTFQQQASATQTAENDASDEFAAPADGLQGVLEQLHAGVVAKQGTAEQLQALFVAACRAQGLLVRSVRCAMD